jgi:lipoate-protein ligase A
MASSSGTSAGSGGAARVRAAAAAVRRPPTAGDAAAAARAMSLPEFGTVTVHDLPLDDGIAREAAWLAQVAASGRPTAQLWRAPAGFVVPRSYERLPRFADACAAAAAEGWPVQVRASGGGLVPQGPGVWNLSLAWPGASASPQGTDTIYRALADGLAAALAQLGVEAAAQPVEGSFCDGRFNLAAAGRKLVGTAQAWRRVAGRPVVLAHAVVVATADPAALTAAANRFEAAAGGPRRYRADALTSVAEAWCAARSAVSPPPDLEHRLVRAIADGFARNLPLPARPASPPPMET